jgi:hypothetical protein
MVIPALLVEAGGWHGLHGCETSCEVCKGLCVKERALREFLTGLFFTHSFIMWLS